MERKITRVGSHGVGYQHLGGWVEQAGDEMGGVEERAEACSWLVHLGRRLQNAPAMAGPPPYAP